MTSPPKDTLHSLPGPASHEAWLETAGFLSCLWPLVRPEAAFKYGHVLREPGEPGRGLWAAVM